MGSCANALTEDLKMDECHALLPTDAVWKRESELIPRTCSRCFWSTRWPISYVLRNMD